MASRQCHPVGLAGGVLWCAVVVVTLGCRVEKIVYEPEDPPSTSDSSEGETPGVEATEPEDIRAPEPDATEPVLGDPADDPAAEAPDVPALNEPAASDPGMADELFPDEPAEPGPGEAGQVAPAPIATPRPEPSAESGAGSLLPWEVDEPAVEPPSLPENEVPTPSPAASPPADVGPPEDEPVFPWDEPEVQPAEADEPAGEAIADPLSEPPVEAPADSLPALDSLPPTPELPPLESVAPPAKGLQGPQAPRAQTPVTSPHAAWLLGSKMSFALVAPEEQGRDVVRELEPLASLLGVELPPLDYAELRGSNKGMTRLLAAGRDVGDDLAAKYDDAHAALVEVALKSNLLMAVYAEKPHLAHSIAGAVAAAAVRAGIPEEIWQPWQDAVVAGGTTEEVGEAVIRLHTDIESYLRTSPNEAAQAIMR